VTGSDPPPGDAAASAAAAATEWVEEVDVEGRVLRIVTRAQVRREGLRHRTVFVAVLDRAGRRVLAHQRAPWKDVWPHAWDIAFGGLCGVGEAWDDAARRELREEAGLHAPVRAVGRGTYEHPPVAEVASIYLAQTDDPPTCPDGEVVATEWVDLDGLDGWIAARRVCPDSVALVLPHLRPT